MVIGLAERQIFEGALTLYKQIAKGLKLFTIIQSAIVNPCL